MIRKTALAIAAALPLALLLPAVPAAAMTPRAVDLPANGWRPTDPPSDLALFRSSVPYILYAVTCGGVSATAWSADGGNDPDGDWDTVLITTSQLSQACLNSRIAPVVRQGDDTFTGRGYGYDASAGVGTMQLTGEEAYSDWDFVPSPRIDQWVAVGARSQFGESLPLLELLISSVGDDTFAVSAAIPASYIGAPVLDNMGRALGVVTAAGTVITGAPQFCPKLFACTDPTRVWWDITAPSIVPDVKAVPGKRSVIVTWKPVASMGGTDEVGYWYRVGTGEWKNSETFRARIKAKRGTKVTVTVVAINDAGPGPQQTVWAKAR